MTVKILLRRDNSADWISKNPKLSLGEPGYETDTGKLKIGDGVSFWDDLPYFGGDQTTFFDVNNDIIPAENNTYDLGSLERQWRHLYVSNNTIYVGGVPLTIENNTLVIGEGEDTSNIATEDFVSSAVDAAVNEIVIPTTVSALVNDSGFITIASVPNNTNQLTNGAGFITAADIPAIPADISDLTDTTNLLQGTDFDQTLNTTDSVAFASVSVNGAVEAKDHLTITSTDVDALEEAYLEQVILLEDQFAQGISGTPYTGTGTPANKLSYEALIRAKAINPLIPDVWITRANSLRNAYYAWAAASITLTPTASGFTLLNGGGVGLRYEEATGLRFPDNTYQTTAFTGDYEDLDNKPAIPADISDLTDTDGLLGQGGGANLTVTVPGTAYKGFVARYGRVYGNSTPEELTVSKIVIYKDTAVTASTIADNSDIDDFDVTGLGDSDVVTMFILYGDTNGEKSLDALRTFVRAAVDNVILADGVEGSVNTISAMRTAFYNSGQQLLSASGGIVNNFQFYNYNNQYQVSFDTAGQGTGSGFDVNQLAYNLQTDQPEVSGWGNGPGYTQGDVIVIPGTSITYDGDALLSPDNDITITITQVNVSGFIDSFTVTGTLPPPPPLWPENSISDGGSDQYDTGNYINTNLAQQISYNGGVIVEDATEQFGAGSKYVVVYDNGIFGVFATGSSATQISTSGGSGADGSSSTDTGELLTVDRTYDPAVTNLTLTNDPLQAIPVTFVKPDGDGGEIDVIVAHPDLDLLEETYLEAELMFGDFRDQDAQMIAPETRPWDGLPSYQAYELIITYEVPDGVLPPSSALVVMANSTRSNYLTWREALAESVGITRGLEQGIYNPYQEEGWDSNVSPIGTLWSVGNTDDLSDIESRTYTNFYAAYGSGSLGNRVPGSKAVMFVPDNGKYYLVEWASWAQGGSYGGFSYTRTEIDTTQVEQGLRFPDGSVLTTAEGLGRVKSTAPGNRRIEEVVGYKEVSVTARTEVVITTTASRSVVDSNNFWVDITTTTIDDILNDYNQYQVDGDSPIEFSLDNNTWYIYNGGYSSSGNERGYSTNNTTVTYNQGDTVYFRYSSGGFHQTWWNRNELPSGGTNFRGAVIDYHAYTGEATWIGTIHIVDDDGDDNITHTEVSSGSTDSENDDLWVVTSEGQIRYRRIDGESKTLKVHWTAKVFYGSETYD